MDSPNGIADATYPTRYMILLMNSTLMYFVTTGFLVNSFLSRRDLKLSACPALTGLVRGYIFPSTKIYPEPVEGP